MKITFGLILLFSVLLILFSVFYKIKTYYVGALIMFQDSQIIQIKKDSDTNFKLNQKIRLYTKTTNFFAMIENLTQDAHFFYLNLDVFIENPE